MLGAAAGTGMSHSRPPDEGERSVSGGEFWRGRESRVSGARRRSFCCPGDMFTDDQMSSKQAEDDFLNTNIAFSFLFGL